MTDTRPTKPCPVYGTPCENVVMAEETDRLRAEVERLRAVLLRLRGLTSATVRGYIDVKLAKGAEQ